jgi:hypothetical protein
MAIGDHKKINSRNANAFKKLVNWLVEHHGSIGASLAAIGISDHSYYRLFRDDEIVACVGRKIVNCYQQTKEVKN